MLPGVLTLLMPGLEARRAVPGEARVAVAGSSIALLPELRRRCSRCGYRTDEAIVVPLAARDAPADRFEVAGFSVATGAFFPR